MQCCMRGLRKKSSRLHLLREHLPATQIGVGIEVERTKDGRHLEKVHADCHHEVQRVQVRLCCNLIECNVRRVCVCVHGMYGVCTVCEFREGVVQTRCLCGVKIVKDIVRAFCVVICKLVVCADNCEHKCRLVTNSFSMIFASSFEMAIFISSSRFDTSLVNSGNVSWRSGFKYSAMLYFSRKGSRVSLSLALAWLSDKDAYRDDIALP